MATRDSRSGLACCVLFVGALVSTTKSQEARLLGKLVDDRGKAVENALVVLRAHGWRYHPELGDVHEARVRTDAKGRFRASVHASRRYSAWARWPGDEPRFSEVVENVVAGRVLTLREETLARHRVTLRVRGLAAWKSLAPFRVRVTSLEHNFSSRELALAKDDSFRLPDAAGTKSLVELLDKDGRSFFCATWAHGQVPASEGLTGAQAPEPRSYDWTIPAPRRVTFRFAALEAPTQALAKVRVTWLLRESHRQRGPFGRATRRYVERPIGTADATGQLVATLPVRAGDDPNVHFLVRTTGRARTWIDVTKASHALPPGKPLSSFRVLPDASIEVKARLPKSKVFRARLLDRNGQPMAGVVVRTTRHASFRESSFGPLSVDRELLRTGPSGELRIAEQPLETKAELEALLTPTDAKRLFPELDLPPSSGRRFVVPLGRFDTRVDEAVDIGGTQLRAACAQIKLVSSGGKASFARLFVIREEADFSHSFLDALHTDRRGYATFFVPKETWRLLALHPELGYVDRVFDKDELGSKRTAIAVSPYRWLRGRVVDKKGKGIPFARIQELGTSMRSTERKHVLTLNRELRPKRCDARGDFRCPYVPENAITVKLRASVVRNGRYLHSTRVHFPFEDADPDPIEFVIDLAKARRR